MSPAPIATERVYLTDANGIRRLAAAPGDVIPEEIPAFGMVTPGDPQLAAIVPLDGYETLTEDQVVELLPGLSPDELVAVQAYERTHAARGSIVRYGQTSRVVTAGRKARRKQADARATADEAGDPRDVAPEDATVEVPAASTSQGYDAMSPEELQTEADKRGLSVVGTGSGGNVLKKDLVGALQADDAKQDQ